MVGGKFSRKLYVTQKMCNFAVFEVYQLYMFAANVRL